ncbi:hypothetical protein [Mucilaginibacter sp. 10I4]|uniref:hypothetical protein n=1 Tax=Mucilaginibacter sp. 10I4 TaxID=3048580 RepID=UPI002B23DBE3|nr:hypothetical protein [Mucilaginibacter sp. 10I4]MEB0260729.1 hypothetical protein [Mucilaginibacter sp. 10I4]
MVNEHFSKKTPNSTIIHGPMPRTNISQDKLRDIVFQAIKIHTDSIQFGTIVNTVTRHLKTVAGSFVIPSNTTYTGDLDDGDKSRIGEIVWDFVILRYLTPSDYHNDDWPHLSLTEKGKAFLLVRCSWVDQLFVLLFDLSGRISKVQFKEKSVYSIKHNDYFLLNFTVLVVLPIATPVLSLTCLRTIELCTPAIGTLTVKTS